MKCPVCGKDATTHIYKCARYGVYVREKCWAEAHGEGPQEVGIKDDE